LIKNEITKSLTLEPRTWCSTRSKDSY